MSTPVRGHVGFRQLRLEDADLLTGRARFTADEEHDGGLHVVFVRSQIAHGTIISIDASVALDRDDVVAVLTSDDLDVPAIALPTVATLIHPDFHRRPIARRTVRFVGEVLAVVVAETARAAAEASELVLVDIAPLPIVTTPSQALAPGAPVLFPAAGSNIALHTVRGQGHPDPGATVEVRTKVVTPRMAVMPMETTAIIASPGADGSIDIVFSCQMPHRFRDFVAALLQLPPDKVSARCPWVGGGFGGKPPVDPDYLLVVAAALHVGRPLRWVQTRAENLLTMHGRGHTFDVTLAATPDGRVRSMRVSATTDVGAYPGIGIGMIRTASTLATGTYAIDHLAYEITCVATNTPPTGAFRGAGRPEAMHAIERAMDELAAELGIDPAELRRINYVPASAFPYTNAAGETYDSGDFGTALGLALELARYDDVRAEQTARPSGSRHLLGIGISSYVEVSASPGLGLDSEQASATLLADGSVRLAVGTSAHGQGHHTIYAQIAGDVLGMDVTAFSLDQSDTFLVPTGKGTGGSRSAHVGGSAVHLACLALLEQSRAVAARMTERPASTISIERGVGLRAPDGRVVSWADIGGAGQLHAVADFDQHGGTAPFGCHVAVVEVDRETGTVKVRDFVAVDDCGVVINPLTAEGQVHGGVAAGMAEALFEEVAFDAAGCPIHASLADYVMPSAADLTSITSAHTVTPTTLNPLGAKGLGESGTTGSVAAVHNAVEDALRQVGGGGTQIPLLPMTVWSALQPSASEH